MKDDAKLIDASLAGDTAAFGQLVQKYQDRLYHTMTHVVGSLEDAEDIVQDALVQAFVKLDTFQGASAFFTWLYRIAFNLAMSQKRRTKPVRSIDEVREQTGSEPIDQGPRPERQVLADEQAGQVRAALASLADDHRTILVLREMEGCDYESIAEILDVPVGTVRSRLHRARMQLREQLLHVLEESP